MPLTFKQFFNKIKWRKASYFWNELEPLLKLCWDTACPPKKMTRSEKQNRYYWGVVLKIMGDDIGYLPDECHQLMGKQFLKYESKGEWFIKSTTKLKTGEMEEYLENVRRFAAMELHINIPTPNETAYDYDTKFKEAK